MTRTLTSINALVLLGAGMALTPSLAFAQDEQSCERERRGIAEATGNIVVTATKTQNAEDVQDVPLAVTAFNADSLDALNVRDVQRRVVRLAPR